MSKGVGELAKSVDWVKSNETRLTKRKNGKKTTVFTLMNSKVSDPLPLPLLFRCSGISLCKLIDHSQYEANHDAPSVMMGGHRQVEI